MARRARAYEDLTTAGKTRRLREVARAALAQFGLKDASLSLIANWENVTFRVDAADRAHVPPFQPGRFLLRLHRPGYQTEAAIQSELLWLLALRETAILAPLPVPAPDGRLAVRASAEGVPQEHVVTLLRWLPGQAPAEPSLAHAAEIGDLLARLHDHADSWPRPPGFERRTLDEAGYFGGGAEGDVGPTAWESLPEEARALCEAGASRVRGALRELPREGGAFGLIHGDLHMRNVIAAGQTLHPIDFDDAAFAYRISDFCPALGQRRELPDYGVWRDTILNSYSKRRPLPAKIDSHLDTFQAARRIHLLLWMVSRAPSHEGFRQEVKSYLPRVVTFLKSLG